MTDLLRHLRDPRYFGQEGMRQQAADEIERLESDLRQAIGVASQAGAEAARLRPALEKITQECNPMLTSAVRIAADALKSRDEQVRREARERAAIQQAQQTGKPVVYIDDDGCEVSAMPSGHAFYNVADWY